MLDGRVEWSNHYRFWNENTHSSSQMLLFSFVAGFVAFFLTQKFFIIYHRWLSEKKILTIHTTGLRPNFAGVVVFSFVYFIFVVVTSPYVWR